MIQVVLSSWSLAEAVAIHPDHLSRWTDYPKKKLWNLREWAYIRATSRYPPSGPDFEIPGGKASEADREWAAKPFDEI